MGLIMLHARLAAKAPRLANFLGRRSPVKRLGGISPERDLPQFAPQTFVEWFAARGEAGPAGTPVVLFPDTFSNYLHPEALQAAVEVLEAAGRRVVVPRQALCCGRPLYDYGMLDTARLFWKRMLSGLRRPIREGVPVVCLEPSCATAFRDELPAMMPHVADARRLGWLVCTLAEYLALHVDDWEPPRLERRAVVHGHCHQKAVIGMEHERALYERMGLDFELLDSGCCGLAGSFGFEREHHDISLRIGEHKLMPMLREASKEAIVIADGFSCRTQIEQMTDRRPLHTAEVLRMALGR